MLATLSSNVVLAKARTMYGRRLTEENYKDLLKCKTVREVASYLKDRTAYSKVLAGIEETEIHRGGLELKLREKLAEDFNSLCRYEITIGEKFGEYFLRRGEMNLILQTILFLNAGESEKPDEEQIPAPLYLQHHTGLNLAALRHSSNYDEMLTALAHTPYEPMLKPFRPEKGQRIDYTGIEIALYSHLFDGIFNIIQKYSHGQTKRQLLDIFNSFVDLTNYVRIVRLKEFHRVSPEKIKKSLLPFGTLKRNILDQMAAADTEDEMQSILGRTKIGKRVSRVQHSYVDEIPRRVNFGTCHHYIDFSTHPSVVLISYVFLCEEEIADIVTIVEGIRYNLAPDEIKKMLTVLNSREGSDT